MRLKDKVALVTGGASGFGAEIVRRFVREWAAVVIVDLNGEGAADVAKETGNARALKGDVTNRADVEQAVALAMEAFGCLDILVNNAGWTHSNKPVMEVTEEEFDRTLRDQRQIDISHGPRGRSGNVCTGWRLHYKRRFDSRYSAATRSHLVQCIKRRCEPRIEIALGRAGVAQDQSKLRCAGDG